MTVAIRSLLKQKAYTLTNIVGLSTGIAVCLMLGLYVHHWWSFDRHHPDADRLYQV